MQRAVMPSECLQWHTRHVLWPAGPLDSPAAAHKAVRGMIAQALRDPYTKFISPQVGMNCALHGTHI